MAGLDTVIEWLKTKMPAVLVSSFSAGVACLSTAALIIKTMFAFDWRDVFASAGFLFALAAVLCLWIVTLANYWTAPSVHKLSRIGLPLLLLGICFTLFAAVRQSEYAYNQMGLYQSRDWKLMQAEAHDRTFTSEIIAVQDLSQRPFFVTVSIDSACPQATMIDFAPSLVDKNVYRFESEERSDSATSSRSRKWRINGFQPPAKLLLIAKIRNASSWIGQCLAYDLAWDAAK